MIKTKLGIYLDPKKDIKGVLDQFPMPFMVRIQLQNLDLYMKENESFYSLVLLQKGSILEEYYSSLLGNRYMKESQLYFEPKTIILWNDRTYTENIRRENLGFKR